VSGSVGWEFSALLQTEATGSPGAIQPKGPRSVRGLQVKGKAGQVNSRETSLMFRHC
jgi:hypothetical protein